MGSGAGSGVGSACAAMLMECPWQFWSVYVPCETQNKDAVKRTLEQMDVVQRMCDLYPDTFACVTDSDGERAQGRHHGVLTGRAHPS